MVSDGPKVTQADRERADKLLERILDPAYLVDRYGDPAVINGIPQSDESDVQAEEIALELAKVREASNA